MQMNLTDMLEAVESGKPCETCSKPRAMTAFPAETPIGMAYVPFQQWKNIYEASVALDRGTIFEDLDKPFLGERPA